jgi:hypothetical protein
MLCPHGLDICIICENKLLAKLPSGYKIKNGKVVKTEPRKSVSQRIAEKKSKKQRVVRRTKGT